jgi:hypothetical protein
MAGPIDEVVRELLVRRLDAWGPAALQRSRRATFLQAYGASAAGTAEAALRVFDEFTDMLRGRMLTVVVVAPDADDQRATLDAVYRELDAPSTLVVHPLAGDLSTVPVAAKAASAAGAPMFAFLDAADGPPPPADALSAVAAGKPGEVLMVLGAPARSGLDHREALRAAGFPLVSDVELVDGAGDVRLVAFATPSAKSLDAFKDAMWAVDEYAGVRYRDPRDPEAHLLDISLRPHPGPLKRELLAHLATVGSASVTDLRRFTVTETVYRAADTTAVVTALLKAGQVTRTPEAGRLSGDVLIAARRRTTKSGLSGAP